MARLLSLLLITLMLSGCGTFADPSTWFGSKNPELQPAELQDITESVNPSVAWSHNIGELTNEYVRLQPVIYQSVVYAVDREGVVTALDARSGNVQWSVETELPASAGPAVGEGLLLIGTSEAEVVALDMQTGESKWHRQLTGEIQAVPAISSGTIVVHTLDGNLFGLNAESGEQRWRYDRTVPVLTLRGTSSPVIAGDSVIVGLAGGKLIALEVESGKPRWERNITLPTGRSDLERITDVATDPLVYSGVVYVGSYQGEVAAVGQMSGNMIWNRKISVHNTLAIDWQGLYASDEQGTVWSMDPDSGAAKWRQADLKNRKLSPPAIAGDYVVVGDYEGYVHWLSTRDGSIVGRMQPGDDGIIAAPFVVDGMLYVLDLNGDLTAIQIPE